MITDDLLMVDEIFFRNGELLEGEDETLMCLDTFHAAAREIERLTNADRDAKEAELRALYDTAKLTIHSFNTLTDQLNAEIAELKSALNGSESARETLYESNCIIHRDWSDKYKECERLKSSTAAAVTSAVEARDAEIHKAIGKLSGNGVMKYIEWSDLMEELFGQKQPAPIPDAEVCECYKSQLTHDMDKLHGRLRCANCGKRIVIPDADTDKERT